ncbi:MAG: phospho-sugar mutase [Eubacteriales bacterium]|nr:phospho-sugar mutase [Eubacteriales bacterium]
MTAAEKYRLWIENEYYDPDTRSELLKIKDDETEIEDRFYRDLEFGTGGLRGVIGAGTNRINIYTIRKAAQGFASFLLKNIENTAERGIVLAYDSRRKSDEFALEAAKVFAENGITAYLFESLRPTPELSFAVRYLNAAGGAVVTASHNPSEYNGFKVYGEDGGQMTPEHTDMVIREINSIEDIASLCCMDKDEAVSSGLLKYIGREVDDAYIETLKKVRINAELTEKAGRDFRLVYTPLHGSGYMPVTRILKEIGIENVIVVPEQATPDPTFPTVKYPNPEQKEAFTLAIELAKKENADLIIGTDPDADRMGLVVRDSRGAYMPLTGNQTGCLLMEYILSNRKVKGTLPAKSFVCKTIVTTGLANAIAEDYGVRIEEVLTGFKYIGEKIKELEENGDMKFIFGFEESYGYLAGTHARDKDAVVASMLTTEMAVYYASKGMTVYDALEALYKKYGYYIEGIESFTLEGKAGVEKIANTMDELRAKMPDSFGKSKVSAIRDYLKGIRYELDSGTGVGSESGSESVIESESETGSGSEIGSGTGSEINLPSSNVLYYEMADGSWLCIRPSGTEPKLKIYFGVNSKQKEAAEHRLDTLKADVIGVMNRMLS